MSQKRKLEGETEVRATARDVLHDIVKSKPHNVSNAASHFVQSGHLHEGDNGQIGSKHRLNYTLGGKCMTVKKELIAIDEEKKYVKYRFIEGDPMKDYKNFTAALEVIPKDNETCIAKVTFEYVKMHPGVPEPTALMDSWLEAFKLVDDHHHGIKN